MFRADPDKQEQKQEAKAQKEIEREAKAFAESPAGLARAARRAGAGMFQIQLSLQETTKTPWLAAGVSHDVTSGKGRVHHDTLSAIEAEGWRLEHVGYVFVQTGSISRDKMLSTGQSANVTGYIAGIYLFRVVEPVHT